MTKSEHIRHATRKIDAAIEKLAGAKRDLLRARSELHIRLVTALAELEEIHDILTDPVCTPEMYFDDDLPNVPDPDFDDCRWDGDRIEATKSLLFQEYIRR